MDTTPAWLQEEPFAHALDSRQLKRYCSHCLLRKTDDNELFRCTQCNFVYYCSVDCQRKDWLEHKTECKRVQTVMVARRKAQLPDGLGNDFPDVLVRLMARMVGRVIRSDHVGSAAPGGRSWSDLICHIKQLKDSDSQYDEYQNFCDRYALFVGRGPWKLHQKRMELMYSKLRNNMFSITDDKYAPIGNGLYISLSRIKHSCAPNGRLAFRGRRCHVVPVGAPRFEAADELQWADVSVSYINNLVSRDERRQTLGALYQLDCDCAGCRDKPVSRAACRRVEAALVQCNDAMTALACPDRQCVGKAVDVERDAERQAFVCDKCHRRLDRDELAAAAQAMRAVAHTLERCADPAVGAAEKRELAEQTAAAVDRRLYKFNVLRMRAFNEAYEQNVVAGGTAKKKQQKPFWEKAVELGHEVHDGYAFYLGEWDPVRLVFDAQLAGACLHAADVEAAMALLFQARAKYEHAHGRGTPAINDVLRLMRNAGLN